MSTKFESMQTQHEIQTRQKGRDTLLSVLSWIAKETLDALVSVYFAYVVKFGLFKYAAIDLGLLQTFMLLVVVRLVFKGVYTVEKKRAFEKKREEDRLKPWRVRHSEEIECAFFSAAILGVLHLVFNTITL